MRPALFVDTTIMETKHLTSATYDDYMRLPEGAPYELIAG
jgi:Uma2 family endonuclease